MSRGRRAPGEDDLRIMPSCLNVDDVSPDNEGILHCEIDDLCKNVLSARSSPDMIRSFGESVSWTLDSWLS